MAWKELWSDRHPKNSLVFTHHDWISVIDVTAHNIKASAGQSTQHKVVLDAQTTWLAITETLCMRII